MAISYWTASRENICVKNEPSKRCQLWDDMVDPILWWVVSLRNCIWLFYLESQEMCPSLFPPGGRIKSPQVASLRQSRMNCSFLLLVCITRKMRMFEAVAWARVTEIACQIGTNGIQFASPAVAVKQIEKLDGREDLFRNGTFGAMAMVCYCY